MYRISLCRAYPVITQFPLNVVYVSPQQSITKACFAAFELWRIWHGDYKEANEAIEAAPVEIPDRLSLIKQLGETVVFAPTRVVEKARELQKMLNLAGAHLLQDGKAGRNTSDAYFRVTGKFLTGDPKVVA